MDSGRQQTEYRYTHSQEPRFDVLRHSDLWRGQSALRRSGEGGLGHWASGHGELLLIPLLLWYPRPCPYSQGAEMAVSTDALASELPTRNRFFRRHGDIRESGTPYRSLTL